MRFALILWFTISTFAYGGQPSTEIVSLREMLDLLEDARTLDFEGNPPKEPKISASAVTFFPVVKYPIRLSGRSQIRPVADLFRRTQFRKDEIATNAFRRGGKISSNTFTIITINGKHWCTILSDSLIFANHLTYENTADRSFHHELVRVIATSAAESPKVKAAGREKL